MAVSTTGQQETRARTPEPERLPEQRSGPRARPPGPEEPRGPASGDGRRGLPFGDALRSRRFWLVFLFVALANWFLVPIVFPEPQDRISVSYSVFKQQVEGGNVAQITSHGDTIQGTFRTPIVDLASATEVAPAAIARR